LSFFRGNFLFEADLLFEKLLDLAYFLQNLGTGAPSTVRGLVPEIDKSFFELFLRHCRLR